MDAFHNKMEIALWLQTFCNKEAKLRSSPYVSKLPVTKSFR